MLGNFINTQFKKPIYLLEIGQNLTEGYLKGSVIKIEPNLK